MSKDKRPVKVNIPPHMLDDSWKPLAPPQEEKEKQNEDDNSEKRA